MFLPVNIWSEHAACKGSLHIFYGEDNHQSEKRKIRVQKAKSICFICPVLKECRDYARSNAEFGIWGGEDEEERYLAGSPMPPYATASVARRLRNMRKKETV